MNAETDLFVELGRIFLSHFRRRDTILWRNLDLRCAFIIKLLNKSLFTKIKIYMLPRGIKIDDARLREFPHLKVLYDHGKITDISSLNLEMLIMDYYSKITDISAQKMLKVLSLPSDSKTLNLSSLIQLEKLYERSEDIDISKLANLNTLHIGANTNIYLPKLRHLKLGFNVDPNNIMFMKAENNFSAEYGGNASIMNQLESLESESDKITDMHLSMLRDVKHLKLNRGKISNDGLRHLDLYSFDYYGNDITYEGIEHMHLHKLVINGIDSSFQIPADKISLYNCILINHSNGGYVIEMNHHRVPDTCNDRYDTIPVQKKQRKVKTMSVDEIRKKMQAYINVS